MRYGLYRAFGSSSMCINNGVSLVCVACLLMYAMTNRVIKPSKGRIAYVLNGIAIITTISRTPILAFVLINIVWLLRSDAKLFVKKILPRMILVIGLLALIYSNSTTVQRYTKNVTNMFVAIVDSSVANEISSEFGSNAEGTGERFELYTWINDELGSRKLFGAGANAEFKHQFQMTKKRTSIKISIENQYLKIYFYFGYVGLSIFIVYLLGNLRSSFRGMKATRERWAYSFVSVVIQLVFLGCWFLVASVDDFRWYLLAVTLGAILKRLRFNPLYNEDEVRI